MPTGRQGRERRSQCRGRRSLQRREESFLTPSLTSLDTSPPVREKHSQSVFINVRIHPFSIPHTPIPHTLIPRFLVRVSYLELYNEEVSDLLSKAVRKRLEVHVRPDVGVTVRDLSCFVVKNADEMEKLMTIGDRNSELGKHHM